MAVIKHNLVIKTACGNIFSAITTEDGLSKWFARSALARPEIGYVNVFVFGAYRNEMKVTKLVPDKMIEWQCIRSVDDWMGTRILFELEKREDLTLLRFSHSGYKKINDTFASCNYDWARFLRSLKLYCETGVGLPA